MARVRKKSFLRVLFFSPFFSISLFLILVMVSVFFFNTSTRERRVRKEINLLEEEIKKAEGEKTNLLETLNYLKSDFFKEKEAREKFGMQKEGEKQIVILPNSENETKNKETIKNEDLPIFKKWWQYLK